MPVPRIVGALRPRAATAAARLNTALEYVAPENLTAAALLRLIAERIKQTACGWALTRIIMYTTIKQETIIRIKLRARLVACPPT